EEAPSPVVTPELRARMGEAAVKAASAVGYSNAGTCEFLLDREGSFYFLEMNTRLQVEHPVTELITGLDLVEQMIRSAYGEKLAFTQKDLKINGWAMESRIYAEDPYRGFLPSIGRLVRYDPPEEGKVGDAIVRNDAGVREGDEISMFYDPMISKLSTWAPDRLKAIDAMGRALEDFHIEGLGQNIPFLAAVMDQARFRSGKISTNYIKDEFPDGFHGVPPTEFQRQLMAAVACAMHRTITQRTAPHLLRQDWIVVENGVQRQVRVTEGAGAYFIELQEEGRTLRLGSVNWRPGKATFSGVLDGVAFTCQVKPAAEGFMIRHRAAQAHVLVLTPRSAELHEKLPPKTAADTSKMVLSPMPGLVVSLDVAVGQEVRSGEQLAIVEAMKMQNIIRAERDGVVKAIGAQAGDNVAADEVLVEFA
ncbi:MAG: biotin/lipoyl-containing protein, partial [Phenylobacterium sp.]